MKEFEAQLDIQAPPKAIADVLADVRFWPEWMPGVDETYNISDQPLTYASIWQEKRSNGHVELSSGRVTDFNLPQSLGYVIEFGRNSAQFLWRLTEVASGTLVTLEITVRRHSVFGTRRPTLAFLESQQTILADLDAQIQRLAARPKPHPIP